MSNLNDDKISIRRVCAIRLLDTKAKKAAAEKSQVDLEVLRHHERPGGMAKTPSKNSPGERRTSITLLRQ